MLMDDPLDRLPPRRARGPRARPMPRKAASASAARSNRRRESRSGEMEMLNGSGSARIAGADAAQIPSGSQVAHRVACGIRRRRRVPWRGVTPCGGCRQRSTRPPACGGDIEIWRNGGGERSSRTGFTSCSEASGGESEGSGNFASCRERRDGDHPKGGGGICRRFSVHALSAEARLYPSTLRWSPPIFAGGKLSQLDSRRRPGDIRPRCRRHSAARRPNGAGLVLDQKSERSEEEWHQ